MERSIRILIAEDNDDHFELLLRELKAQKITFSHRRADTKIEFLKGLREFKPDLVISDYYLPNLDGMTTFRMTRDFDPTIPFILVTGTLGEDTAVECMKAGMTDYVMKEHLGRIGPGVRAAIHRKWAVEELGAAEEKLREKQRFLSNLIETLPGITYQCANDPEWTMEYISESVQELTGHPSKDFLGNRSTSFNNLIHPEDRERIRNEVQEALKARCPYELTYRIRTAAGEEKWVWDKGKGVFGSDGRLLHLEGFVADITGRRKTEEALRQNEERLAAIVENAPDPIVTLTSLGFVQSMNPEAERVSGYSRDEVVGKHFSKANLLSPKSLPVVIKEFSAILTGERRLPYEVEFIRKDGEKITFEANARLLQRRGKTAGIQVILRDLTERKRAEERLFESENRLRTIFDSAPQCVKLLDQEGTILEINPSGLAFLECGSVEEARSQKLELFVAPEHRVAFKALAAKVFQGGSGELEFELIGLKGTRRWLHTHAVPFRNREGKVVAILEIAADVTKSWKLEEQLRQSQKMEAVGRLAGGIAHDFNNILTAITGYTELALKSDTSESVHSDLEEVYKAAERASGLTRQLLSFSRRQTVNARLIEPNELIRNMDKMLRRVIGEDIDFSIQTEKGVKPFKADPGQIEQVIMNLTVNARDALTKGGQVTVGTSFAHVDEAFALQHEGGKAGDYDLLTVKDTGHGMTEEVKKHLFEPFFTTKEAGKGTGLGLATCYGIVKQAGGFIDVQSEPGNGTTIAVYLPISEETDEAGKAPAREKSADGTLPKGAEKVLLVDDESAVRSFAARVLRQQGYTVLEASSGPEALEMLKLKDARDLRLLFTDVMMPKMNGKELAEKLQALRPEVKVLFASGFTEEPLVIEGVKDKKLAFLPKPFSAEALSRKVREVLDKGGSP